MLDVQQPSSAVRRVLVVDDDRGVRRLIWRALGAEGITVDEASDGEEALRRARDARYDAVILDLQLPKLDGMSVLRQLLAAKPGQPVIVFSCTSDASTRRECIRSGARSFLAKPFAIVDLLASVATACSDSGATP